ncbi:MAG: ATP adenylyltransferase [Lysobacterales bacterium]|jgi:ATP adenylyltransferase
MDKIWAPWRVPYITKVVKSKESKVSVFSKVLKENKDKKNLIFMRRERTFAILNLYPYNNGHSLILPNRQVSELEELTAEERVEIFDTLLEVKALLKKTINPQGFNVGVNLGRVAGAGMPEHLHMHVVPRWGGDMNFMPVVGQTKVISQSLSALYDLLIKTQKKPRNKLKK